MLVLVTEQLPQPSRLRAADLVQRPERAQLVRHRRVTLEDLPQFPPRRRHLAATLGAFRQRKARLTREPLVGVRLHPHQIACAQLRQVPPLHMLVRAGGELVNPPARPMHPGCIMALTRVAPVQHHHAAIGAVA